jgi:hypothetical protein
MLKELPLLALADVLVAEGMSCSQFENQLVPDEKEALDAAGCIGAGPALNWPPPAYCPRPSRIGSLSFKPMPH